MLFLRFLFFVISVGALTLAAGIVLYDIWLAFELNRLLQRRPRVQSQPLGEGETPAFEAAPPARLPLRPGPRRAIRWSTAAKFIVIAALSALIGQSILVVPDGEAGVRISQISGVRPGTLYPGVHLIVPLFTRVELYDTREKVFSTAALPNSREKGEVLSIEAREGLSVGLAVAVRYRIDPRRLDYIQTNLPQPLDEQIVAPVVTSVFRELGAELRDPRCFLDQARGVSRARGADHHGAPCGRCHRGQRSAAAQSCLARGIFQRTRRAAAEGAGGRPHVGGRRNRAEAREDRRIASRGCQDP